MLPDETRRVPVVISAAPLRDRAGHAIGLILVVRDMREMTELRRQVVSSARMAAVGQLAAGIAHEIANPLTFIRANLGVLREHWDAIGEGASSEAVHDEGVARSGDRCG